MRSWGGGVRRGSALARWDVAPERCHLAAATSFLVMVCAIGGGLVYLAQSSLYSQHTASWARPPHAQSHCSSRSTRAAVSIR